MLAREKFDLVEGRERMKGREREKERKRMKGREGRMDGFVRLSFPSKIKQNFL